MSNGRGHWRTLELQMQSWQQWSVGRAHPYQHQWQLLPVQQVTLWMTTWCSQTLTFATKAVLFWLYALCKCCFNGSPPQTKWSLIQLRIKKLSSENLYNCAVPLPCIRELTPTRHLSCSAQLWNEIHEDCIPADLFLSLNTLCSMSPCFIAKRRMFLCSENDQRSSKPAPNAGKLHNRLHVTSNLRPRLRKIQHTGF